MVEEVAAWEIVLVWKMVAIRAVEGLWADVGVAVMVAANDQIAAEHLALVGSVAVESGEVK
jgi:hypothetical protein